MRGPQGRQVPLRGRQCDAEYDGDLRIVIPSEHELGDLRLPPGQSIASGKRFSLNSGGKTNPQGSKSRFHGIFKEIRSERGG